MFKTIDLNYILIAKALQLHDWKSITYTMPGQGTVFPAVIYTLNSTLRALSWL